MKSPNKLVASLLLGMLTVTSVFPADQGTVAKQEAVSGAVSEYRDSDDDRPTITSKAIDKVCSSLIAGAILGALGSAKDGAVSLYNYAAGSQAIRAVPQLVAGTVANHPTEALASAGGLALAYAAYRYWPKGKEAEKEEADDSQDNGAAAQPGVFAKGYNRVADTVKAHPTAAKAAVTAGVLAAGGAVAYHQGYRLPTSVEALNVTKWVPSKERVAQWIPSAEKLKSFKTAAGDLAVRSWNTAKGYAVPAAGRVVSYIPEQTVPVMIAEAAGAAALTGGSALAAKKVMDNRAQQALIEAFEAFKANCNLAVELIKQIDGQDMSEAYQAMVKEATEQLEDAAEAMMTTVENAQEAQELVKLSNQSVDLLSEIAEALAIRLSKELVAQEHMGQAFGDAVAVTAAVQKADDEALAHRLQEEADNEAFARRLQEEAEGEALARRLNAETENTAVDQITAADFGMTEEEFAQAVQQATPDTRTVGRNTQRQRQVESDRRLAQALSQIGAW